MSTRCPNCSEKFSPHPNKLPIILPSCLHHLCSLCITSSPSGQIQCCVPQCHAVVIGEDIVHLVTDRHLLGSLDIQYNKRKHKQEMSDDFAQFSPPTSSYQFGVGQSTLLCVNCRDSISKLTCTSCVNSFCSSQCFSHLHRTPALATHQTRPYEFQDFSEKMICKEHGKNIEFVAVEDYRTGCSFCVVLGELMGRRVVDFNMVVKELIDSGLLKMHINNANVGLGKMLSANSFLSTQSVSSCYQANVNKLESHLDKCHRLLEVVEGRLTTQLRLREEERVLMLSRARKELDQKITKLEQLLEAADWQIEHSDEEKFNLVQLMKEMDKLANEDLVAEMKDQDKTVVSFDQTILSSISSHISVRREATPDPLVVRYSTQDTTQLDQTLTELLGRLCEKGEVGSRPVTTRGHFAAVEDVVLLHVESPESFFVMRTRDWQMAETMRVQLSKEWRVGEKGKVKVGDIAVIQVEHAIKYQRVKVITVESDLSWVTFLDQGSCSQVPLSGLVCLSDNMSTWPPLAHHCTLATVCSELEWRVETAMGVQKFFGSEVCKATVLGRKDSKSQSTMIVSITREEDQAMISLLDFLVFSGLASSLGADPGISCLPVSGRSFFYLPLDRTGNEHLVKVVHVDSPSHVFINLVGENHIYTDYMDSLMEEMQHEYGRDMADGQSVLLPYLGLVCASHHTEDGKYYRGKVTDLLEDSMVRVVLVDLGYSVVVHCSVLRRLLDKFLVLPAMAVSVCLAGVRPMGEGWSGEATEFVMGIVRNKIMRMRVREGKTQTDECKVILSEINVTPDASVNTTIVKEGYATAIPELDLSEEDDKHLCLYVDLENNLPRLVRRGVEPGTRLTCRVVSASSPYNICLRRLAEEESFYQMSTDLASYYETNCASVLLRHWPEGVSCVVKTPGEGWVRAKVDREMEGAMVELLLYDYGSKFVGTVECIRPLPDEFCAVGPYCWTVHLTNIVPAGGAKTWTGVACEKMKEIILGAGMEVDIEVVEDVIGDSWPVVILIKEKDESSGPLDLEQFTCKSVGDILMDLGLAIPPGAGNGTVKLNGVAGGDVAGNTDVRLEVINEISTQEASENFGSKEAVSSFHWICAEIPSSSKFAGFVSHVDWDCNLYMSSILDNQDNLRIIESVLDSKYSGSSPSTSDLQWSKGQACIAQFCLDNKWYRGEVLQVRDMGECLVKFVDYGSEELCKPQNMRKGLFMTDIPVQCFTVQMNINPITIKWEEGVLNFIHKTVVEQVLEVTIIEHSKTFPLLVRLVTKAGLDIRELLVKNGYGRERHSGGLDT